MYREKEMTSTRETTKEKNLNMEVTPNVKYCLKLMEMAMNGLPDGDLKSSCQPALEYLLETARGIPQHYGGGDCNWARVIPPDEITSNQ